MSVRNNKLSSKKSESNNFYTTHTLVRSELFYYLKFTNYERELYNSGSKLKSKPTIIFYTENATDKVVLDYTFMNETDRKYLSSFFTNMNTGDTFTVSNGSYVDDTREIEADVSCTLTFTEYNNDKVIATVTSVTDKDNAIDIYEADFFVGIPQLSKTGSLGDNISTQNMALVSVTNKTKNKLETLGLIPGDYIEVINPNSSNDKKVYKILEYSVLNEREILRIEGEPIVESLVGSPTLINLYVKGIYTIPQNLVGDLGCCYIGDSQKIENNTNYQCSVRGGTHFKGVCPNVFPEQISLTTPIIDENIFITGLSSTLNAGVFENTISFTNSADGPVPVSTISVYFGNFDTVQNNKILVKRDNNYTFKQTDISNQNYIIRFSTNKTSFVPYVSGTYGLVKRNGIDSNTVLQVTTETPNLYVFLEQIIETQSGITNKFYYSGYDIMITD